MLLAHIPVARVRRHVGRSANRPQGAERHATISCTKTQFCSYCTAANTAATGLESVTLGGGDDAPVLVRLPQRPWGAAAQLSQSAVQPMLGKWSSQRPLVKVWLKSNRLMQYSGQWYCHHVLLHQASAAPTLPWLAHYAYQSKSEPHITQHFLSPTSIFISNPLDCAGGRKPKRVSVLRDAFSSFDQKGRPLAQVRHHPSQYSRTQS